MAFIPPRPTSERDDPIVTPPRSEPDEKAVADVTAQPTEGSDKPRDFPLSWKLTALACGLALSWGSSFSENTLGPLKGTLRKELDITNAQVWLSARIRLFHRTTGISRIDLYPIVWGHLLGHFSSQYNPPHRWRFRT